MRRHPLYSTPFTGDRFRIRWHSVLLFRSRMRPLPSRSLNGWRPTHLHWYTASPCKKTIQLIDFARLNFTITEQNQDVMESSVWHEVQAVNCGHCVGLEWRRQTVDQFLHAPYTISSITPGLPIWHHWARCGEQVCPVTHRIMVIATSSEHSNLPLQWRLHPYILALLTPSAPILKQENIHGCFGLILHDHAIPFCTFPLAPRLRNHG